MGLVPYCENVKGTGKWTGKKVDEMECKMCRKGELKAQRTTQLNYDKSRKRLKKKKKCKSLLQKRPEFGTPDSEDLSFQRAKHKA
ncbi:hypothetical protein CEXT_85771 [Caerostris extrusa]|uniref:Uncharacterized protein n=1 Tax=Caerostris extrusa TaxID=172846 RepID=A0AAV4QYP1_CAEEX|nr:hypothetical protein CEXT_85771 [Caerostris extrusa]